MWTFRCVHSTDESNTIIYLILGIDGFTVVLEEWQRIRDKWLGKKIVLIFRFQAHFLAAKAFPKEVVNSMFIDEISQVGYLPLLLQDILTGSSTIPRFCGNEFGLVAHVRGKSGNTSHAYRNRNTRRSKSSGLPTVFLGSRVSVCDLLKAQSNLDPRQSFALLKAKVALSL